MNFAQQFRDVMGPLLLKNGWIIRPPKLFPSFKFAVPVPNFGINQNSNGTVNHSAWSWLLNSALAAALVALVAFVAYSYILGVAVVLVRIPFVATVTSIFFYQNSIVFHQIYYTINLLLYYLVVVIFYLHKCAKLLCLLFTTRFVTEVKVGFFLLYILSNLDARGFLFLWIFVSLNKQLDETPSLPEFVYLTLRSREHLWFIGKSLR